MKVHAIGIKVLLSVLFLVSCSNTNAQKVISKKSIPFGLRTINRSILDFYNKKDSVSKKKITYAIARIYGSRERFIFRNWLHYSYQSNYTREIEIFDVTGLEPYSEGVTSFIFFDNRLVIYYSDASTDTYKMICDICTLDLALLDSKKYFILHSKIDKDDNVIVEFLE